jgi:hypothetical protein
MKTLTETQKARLDWFRDSAGAMARVLEEYLAECGPQLNCEDRVLGLEAHAKVQNFAFALIRLTDKLDGVERLERTPEDASCSSLIKEERQ